VTATASKLVTVATVAVAQVALALLVAEEPVAACKPGAAAEAFVHTLAAAFVASAAAVLAARHTVVEAFAE
jgi:hypothetical protein